MPSEDRFDLYRQHIRAELGPVGLVESVLVERIVGLSWRLQRAERFHTEAFDTLYTKLDSDPPGKRAKQSQFVTQVESDFPLGVPGGKMDTW